MAAIARARRQNRTCHSKQHAISPDQYHRRQYPLTRHTLKNRKQFKGLLRGGGHLLHTIDHGHWYLLYFVGAVRHKILEILVPHLYSTYRYTGIRHPFIVKAIPKQLGWANILGICAFSPPPQNRPCSWCIAANWSLGYRSSNDVLQWCSKDGQMLNNMRNIDKIHALLRQNDMSWL